MNVVIWKLLARSQKLVGFSALVLVFIFLLPLSPHMPTAGLDPSWQYAVNEAVARHLVFGRDFIFTVGPYGSIYTGLYDPATDLLMLVGGTVVAIGFCLSFTLLADGRRPLVTLLLLIAIVFSNSKDADLMAMPLFFVLASYESTNDEGTGTKRNLSRAKMALFTITAVAIGILPLVKGSLVAWWACML